MPKSQKSLKSTNRSSAGRRERLTVSLPANLVRFLKQGTTTQKAPSVSAYLENLIEVYQRNAETEQLNLRMVAYYDGISDAERAQDQAWGEMAEGQLKS